jgi:3-dehydroquinate synthase
MKVQEKSTEQGVLVYEPYGCTRSVELHYHCGYPEFIKLPPDLCKKVLVVYDRNLPSATVAAAVKLIGHSAHTVSTLAVVANAKSLSHVIGIWETMLEMSATLVVGLGGGVVCDIVGFASSTYHRGVPHILLPTTLLAMVDAAVGGKTGIDFGGIKNSIGTMHHPLFVHSMLPVLESLDDDHFHAGFAEVIKTIVMFEIDHLNVVEELAIVARSQLSSQDIMALALKSSTLKIRAIEQSEHEREKLLYGHNVGHALEALGAERAMHGRCVAAGMCIEATIAHEMGLVSRLVLERQMAVLSKLGLPVSFPAEVDLLDLMAKMDMYKLADADNYFFHVPVNSTGNNVSGKGSSMLAITKLEFKAWMTEYLDKSSKI